MLETKRDPLLSESLVNVKLLKKKKKNPSSSSSLLNFIAPPSYDIYNGACRGESRWFTLVMTFLAVIIIETIISWVMTHSG